MKTLTLFLVTMAAIVGSGCGKPIPGPQGPAGAPGAAGATGPQGEPGVAASPSPAPSPCVVTQDPVTGDTTIACPTSEVTIPGAASVTVRVFCPTVTGGIGYQESGFMIGGKLYAVYYDGTHAFLTQITPNSYQTTDGRSCSFTVAQDGQIQGETHGWGSRSEE